MIVFDNVGVGGSTGEVPESISEMADSVAAFAQALGLGSVDVGGWSMGGMQAFHWAAMYPGAVHRLAVICGAAKTSPHNQVFIEGVRATLTADAHYQDGRFVGFPERGLRAMGRVYAGWAMSQRACTRWAIVLPRSSAIPNSVTTKST